MYGLQQIKEMNKNPKEFIKNSVAYNEDNFKGEDYTDGEILDILFQESQTESVQELINFIQKSLKAEILKDMIEIDGKTL